VAETKIQMTHEDVRVRNYLATELTIAKFRWFVIGFLFLYSNMLRLNDWPMAIFNNVLLGACAYNLCIHLYIRTANTFSVILTMLFLYCDMIAVGAALAFTGGAASPFLFIWYMLLFTAGIRFGYWRSLFLQCPMALYYTYLLYRHPGVLDPDFLSRLILGVFSFSAVALYGSLFSREEHFTFRVMERFRRQSITDRLTGLHNYAYFTDALRKEHARAERTGSHFAIAIFDLDLFKRVNDTYGHEKGNILLKAVAECIKVNARRMDTVARYGGEEFAVLMPDSNGMEMEVADRIRKKIEETEFMVIADQPIRITISGGVCTFPKSAATLDELMDKADKGLYSAKTNGRNRTCYYEPLEDNRKGLNPQ
jgi:diguanylate cyclase (GGDEF)-like protein